MATPRAELSLGMLPMKDMGMARIEVTVAGGDYPLLRDMVESLDPDAHCFQESVEDLIDGSSLIQAVIIPAEARINVNVLKAAGLVWSVDVRERQSTRL
jgi:hypothetical protein